MSQLKNLLENIMNKIVLFFAILVSIPFTSLRADNFLNAECWRIVGGVEAGAVVTSNAGKSKTFPIESPTDEFYEYSRHHKTQTKAIYGGFIGAEWRGLSNWDIQLDVKYSQSSHFSVNGTLTQGIDVLSQDSYNYKYKIDVRQLLFDAKFSYVNCSRFKPFAIVGLGASFNRAYSFTTTVPPLLTFTRDYKNKTTTGFTYAVGAGLDFEMTECLYLGVSYRFTDFGKASLGSASIDDIPVSGTLSQSSFYANQVIAQLTFLF